MENYAELKAHLFYLETQLLKSEIRKSNIELENLLADDFVEFTSSGKRKTKQDCLNGLETPKMNISNFEIRQLSLEVVLVTYDLKDETRMRESLRSSLWKKVSGRWQMIFHQGTISHLT